MSDNFDKYAWPMLAFLSLMLSTVAFVLGAVTINKTQITTPISISYPSGYLELPNSPDLTEKRSENKGQLVKKTTKKRQLSTKSDTKNASSTKKINKHQKIEKTLK